MRRRWLGIVALCVALALVPLGCDSDDSDETGSSPEATAATSVDGPAPVRAVTLNLLHGLFCPDETDACQVTDRVEIFAELVEDAGCPDLIGLQEVGARLEEVLKPVARSMCDGVYEIEWEGVDSPDRQMVLTSLPVVEQGYLDIANFPWEAYWVRVDSDQGPVDFLTAHFASSSNDPECQPDRCPPVCPTGIFTNECHALETVELFDQRDGATFTIASGDFNAEPGEPTITHFLDAGYVDAWLEAGNAECDPETHAGCTGGGSQPEPFVGMNTPEGPGYDVRIDYVMVRPGADCDLEVASESFAADARAEPLNGMWWPADHAGLLAELACG